MKNNTKFDMQGFILPDVAHAPIYIWIWNDACTYSIIDEQLNEMERLGIRAFYILPEPKAFRPGSMPTNLAPDYMTPEYLDLYGYALKKAKERGMYCWIYDEGGWPSGGACGKVLQDHPEYVRQVLRIKEYSYSKGDIYTKTKPSVLAAFLADKEMIAEGFCFTENSVVKEYSINVDDDFSYLSPGYADYPDLLNKAATEYFIEVTHEKYAAALGSALSENAAAVFTDEPKAPYGAFRRELAERYETMYGESILPHLPLIAGRTKATEENVHILQRWYDLCSRVFCENYLLPCKKWANDYGMAFTGHMDMDHEPLGCLQGGGNFHLMRALRCLDIPGIDVIWRQLYPENKTQKRNTSNAYNGYFPRYASSAAAQNGTKLALTESFGVAGPGLTYDIMRYTIGYQAVRGVNIFNLFDLSLARAGVCLAQELPTFTEKQVYYHDLHRFNRYMERLSYVSTLGERVCDTGLYYPIYDFWGGLHAENAAEAYDTFGRTLEERMVDFDIVDDDVILAADGIEEGRIRMGIASYRHIIIPGNVHIPPETKEVLDRFAAHGGKVSYDLTEAVPVLAAEGDGLRAMHRKMENGEIFCLFRETGETGDYTVCLPAEAGYLLDLEKGTAQRFTAEKGVLPLTLAVGETAVLLLTDETLDAEDTKILSHSFAIPDSFRFRRNLELVCLEDGFGSLEHTEEAAPLPLGDWAERIGSAYSGSGIYETLFTLSEESIGKEGELDLGDVHYSACVYLNDCPLGTALMPPYRLKIPAGILTAENTLKVVVTNTAANWYVHTDYFDKWETRQMSSYIKGEIEYAKDTASGGLYGPVMLYTE